MNRSFGLNVRQVAVPVVLLLAGCSDATRCDSRADDVPQVEPIYQFSFSPDSRFLATIGRGPTIRILEAGSHRTLHRLRHGDRWPVGVAFSPSGDSLLAVYRDGCVVRWEGISTGKPKLSELDALPGNGILESACHGRRIATFDGQNVLRVRDGNTEFWQRAVVAGAWISHLSFSPDGRFLLSCGRKIGARIWSVATGEYRTLDGSERLSIRSARFSPDSRRIISAGFDGRLREWSVASGRQLWAKKLAQNPLPAVCYTPDGLSIVVGRFDGDVLLCERSSPQSQRVVVKLAGCISQVTFTPDGTLHVSSQNGDVLSLRLDESEIRGG